MPDNRQIDETLRYAQAKSPVKLENLSDDGKKLVHDFRAIIDTAREMVLEKNANEEVQNFIYASRQSSVADKAGVNPSISKEDARKDAQNAGQAFETIIKLFLRNGEFRKLIEDAGVIGRDVFADAAVKKIGQVMRDMATDIVAEELPENIVKLLDRLRQSTPSRGR